MTLSMLEKLFSLKDKVVVITGAGGSIAGEIAKTAALCGAKVALLDINLKAALDRTDELAKLGHEVIALECDVLSKASMEKSCDQIVKHFHKINCLINGAGGNKREATTSEDLSFFDIPIEANKWVFDLNFMGTLLPCQVFGKEIVKQESGSIINIASIAGFKPLTCAAAYAAAKAAVINFTQWLAIHICQHYSPKIRVNAIAPGFCATEQNKYLLYDESGQLTDRGKKILDSVPQNRFGLPSELAGAAIWLLSDSASFTTGSVVTIDGGFDAYPGV